MHEQIPQQRQQGSKEAWNRSQDDAISPAPHFGLSLHGRVGGRWGRKWVLYLTESFPKSDWVLNKKWPIHFELKCNYFEYSIKMGTHELCWVQLLKNKTMYFLTNVVFIYFSITTCGFDPANLHLGIYPRKIHANTNKQIFAYKKVNYSFLFYSKKLKEFQMGRNRD